jgi:hypothetical protein
MNPSRSASPHPQEPIPESPPGFLRLFSIWAAVSRALSPSAIAARLDAERSAQIVAGQIMAAIELDDVPEQEALLDAAWAVYGKSAFERAMSSSAWSTQGFLMSPACACAVLSSPRWLASLGPMVPASGWTRRVKASSSLIDIESKTLQQRGIVFDSYAPVHHLCGNDALFEQGGLAIASPWIGPLSPEDELACRALVDEHNMHALEAHIERHALASSIPDVPQAASKRAKSI